MKEHDDDYFIKNAVLCWLHHYGDKGHKWDAIYKELAARDTYTKPQQQQPQQRRVKKTSTEGV